MVVADLGTNGSVTAEDPSDRVAEARYPSRAIAPYASVNGTAS